MSKRLRAALARDVTAVNVHHQFVLKLSAIDKHQNHYIGPVCFMHKYYSKLYCCVF